ncbi:sigma 54-interacting transcriptional regulator [Paucibacter sp. O1-1]|nr:sigma 54-interacting transcriptional regulator [Paucibacter sp. O1-1]MDA3827971.1 sigma 54-interacting transcriptional regulator [Paucibacter sp. O1-1]
MSHDHIDKIEQSHERCVALGVSRIDAPDLSPLGRPDMVVVRDRNRRLHEHAAPVMEMLYEQIVNTENMVVLTDATGTIIHSIGDDDFLSRASKVALQPGVNWSESTKGTNAIGTALVEETPTLVHADEHYLHANHFLTCSAAPILDPRGNILGVLDVSGDQRSYTPAHHGAGEDVGAHDREPLAHRRLPQRHAGALPQPGRVHRHADGGHPGDQRRRQAGGRQPRRALSSWACRARQLRMHSLTTLFGTTVSALVDRFRSPLATPMPVHLNGGRQFHIHARFNWPVWISLAEAVSGNAVTARGPEHEPLAPGASTGTAPVAPLAAAGIGSAALRSDSGLDQLRTGDAQVGSVVDKIRRVLDRDIPILVLGETGTGKELLARAIHMDSARARPSPSWR